MDADHCTFNLRNLRPDDGSTFTMGHEGAGVIEKIHPTAEGKGFQVGDHVGFLYIIDCCYECEGCLTHNMLCTTGKARLQGLTTDGFFADYAVQDWQNLAKLPKDIPLEKCSPIFCAGITGGYHSQLDALRLTYTAFHSVDSCELKPGQWLAVIGAGGLGQLATQYAKAMNFKVLAIDINDGALEMCKNQGADAVFNSKTNSNYVEEVKKLTSGGVHAAAVFSDASAAYANAPKILRLGGTLMMVGLPKDPVPVMAVDIAIGLYKIKGDSTSIPQRMQKAVDFTIKHNILPEVEFRKFEEVQNMVEDMQNGRSTKRMAVVFS